MKVVLDRLHAGYGQPLLQDISLSVGPGECILLCGANGSGKSTLMKTLAGVLPPLSGTVKTDPDTGVRMLPARIPRVRGFSLREFVQASCYDDLTAAGTASKQLRHNIEIAINRMGLQERADRDITALSDGEFQKACIATALARQARLLLLDEPTAFLDVDNRAMVLEALARVCRETGLAILFSSHDIIESARTCTRVFGLPGDGTLRDSGPDAPQGKKQDLIRACFRNQDLFFPV